jgi:hypothetical protein
MTGCPHRARFKRALSELRWRAEGLAGGGQSQKMSVYFSGVEGLATRPRCGAATGRELAGESPSIYNFKKY